MANNCTCKVAPSCPMHGWKKEAARPSVPQQGQALSREDAETFLHAYLFKGDETLIDPNGTDWDVAELLVRFAALAASRSEATPRESNGTGTVVNNSISQVEIVVPSIMENHLKEELRISNYHLKNAHAEIKRLIGAPAAGSAERAQDEARVDAMLKAALAGTDTDVAKEK